MFFRGAIDAGGKAVPPKLPESLDFGFWEALVFLPEERFGGSEDVNEVVEGGCRHFEFQMLYIRGQKLELSSPIRRASMRLREGAISISDTVSHRVSPSLTYAFDAGEKKSISTISIKISSLEAEVKRNESGGKCSSTTLRLYVVYTRLYTLILCKPSSTGNSAREEMA